MAGLFTGFPLKDQAFFCFEARLFALLVVTAKRKEAQPHGCASFDSSGTDEAVKGPPLRC
jgi:hypothetical protein